MIFDREKRLQLMEAREKLLKKISGLENRYEALDRNDPREAVLEVEINKLKLILKENKKEYYESLQEVVFSVCPYTGEPLIGSFDPIGLDGLWWMEFTRNPGGLIKRPTHFRLLRGAVNLQGKTPVGVRHKAMVGPGIPYVIPRILRLPTMKMVISQRTMENGYLVYPLAYFSVEAPAPGQLTSSWLEKDVYYYHDAQGKSAWRVANDAWDFDIANWIQQDKIRWIMPGESVLAPASTHPEDCPFVTLDGVKFPQIVSQRGVFTDALPNPESDEDVLD